MAVPDIPFPAAIPDSYAVLEDEPRFDPAVHLALEMPARIVTLDAFCYDEKTRTTAPSDMAMAGPFRILSDAGVAAIAETARAFRRLNQRTEGDPRAAYIKPRGPAYSSRFIRDIPLDSEPAVLRSALSDAVDELTPLMCELDG